MYPGILEINLYIWQVYIYPGVSELNLYIWQVYMYPEVSELNLYIWQVYMKYMEKRVGGQEFIKNGGWMRYFEWELSSVNTSASCQQN